MERLYIICCLLFANIAVASYTISKKLSYSLSPQPPFERGALVDLCVAPVDRNGIRLGCH
jgi:hypothetical protein